MDKQQAFEVVWSIYKDFHPKTKKDVASEFIVALLEELADQGVIDAGPEWHDSDYFDSDEDEDDEEAEDDSRDFTW